MALFRVTYGFRYIVDHDFLKHHDIEAHDAAFHAAAREGDFERLVSVLHPDVVLRVDFGPERPVRELVGAESVAGQAIMFGRDAPASDTTETVLVNGALGEMRFRGGEPFSLLAFTIAEGRIVNMDIIADAERLGRLGLSS